MGKAIKKLNTAKGVNIHDAKTHLSALIAKVERSGNDVTICRAGKPVAKLVRIVPRVRPKAGFMKGQINIHEDFFKPMDAEWLDAFYNGPIEPPVEGTANPGEPG